MIALKSGREIDAIRRSGAITSTVLSELMERAVPGVSTQELDRFAERAIRDRGGAPTFKGYRGFPASICSSVNQEVVHGIPGSYVLRDGDLLSIDIGTTLDGFVSDSAVTVAVGSVSPAARRLLSVTQECLMIGIAATKEDGHIGDIGAAVQAHAERNGFGVVRELVGHGVGREMHEEPNVPNYGRRGAGPRLRPGLVIAIEPMITEGDPGVLVEKDGWTVVTADGKLAAHFEHTVVVTGEGPKILTLRELGEHPAAETFRPDAVVLSR